MIEIALVTLLQQRGGVGSCVYPSSETDLKSKALPRLVYTLVNDPTSYTDDGASELRTATFQLDAFGATYADASGVIQQVMTSADAPTSPGLDGFRGPISGIDICRVYFGSRRTGPTANAPGQDKAIARATVDVLMSYRSN